MAIVSRLFFVLSVASSSLLFVSAAVAAEPTAAESADLKKMQGKWNVANFEAHDVNPDIGQRMIVEVNGRKLSISINERVELIYEIAIDPGKSPKEITLSYLIEGKKQRCNGIYELDGDAWKLLWNDVSDDARPKAFSAKASPMFCLMVLKPKPDAAAGQLSSTTQKPEPEDGKPYEIVRFDAAALAVPQNWRMLPSRSRQMLTVRSGDGIGVPAADETGEPLQIGLTVERFPAGKDSLDVGLEQVVKSAQSNPRLEVVGKESVEKLKLTDGTAAVLATMEFVKDDGRHSLQLKLLSKDDRDNGWIISAFLVGGKASKLPTPKSELAQWLRSYVVSFCLDGTKLNAAKLKPFATSIQEVGPKNP